MGTKIQALVLVITTMITLTMILIMSSTTSKINCNDPHTWSTESGVQACAINGGK